MWEVLASDTDARSSSETLLVGKMLQVLCRLGYCATDTVCHK